MINGNFLYWREKSLYINLTNGCTNDCIFCVRNYRNGVFGFNLILDKEPNLNNIKDELLKFDIDQFTEIVFTGFGEPLIKLELVSKLSKWIKKEYKKKLSIRVDTNGLVELIHPDKDVVSILRESCIDSFSISLNADNANLYNEICKPKYGLISFSKILEFAKKIKPFFKVQFTVVAIPQINIDACQELAKQLDIPLRIRSYNGPKLNL